MINSPSSAAVELSSIESTPKFFSGCGRELSKGTVRAGLSIAQSTTTRKRPNSFARKKRKGGGNKGRERKGNNKPFTSTCHHREERSARGTNEPQAHCETHNASGLASVIRLVYVHSAHGFAGRCERERIEDNDGGGQYGWTPAVHTLTTHPSRGAHDGDAPVPPPARGGKERSQSPGASTRVRLAASAIACAPRRVAERPGWGGVGARRSLRKGVGPQKESMCASS